jgi:hypothetical protein
LKIVERMWPRGIYARVVTSRIGGQSYGAERELGRGSS